MLTALFVGLSCLLFSPILGAEKSRFKRQTPADLQQIVGGTEATPYSWPFMAMLSMGGDAEFQSIYCGGAVLTENLILTAAHCVYGFTSSDRQDLRVTVGEHDITVNEGNEQRRGVRRIIVHRRYDDYYLKRDIAILVLSEPLDLTTGVVSAIGINTNKSCPVAGATCRVAGWGTLQSGGSTPDRLQEVDVTAISQAACKNAYPGEIFGNMLCAGEEEGGKDSCQGDSGGPLICECDGEWVHSGIVSWGYGCAVAGQPGVYARTSTFQNWINKRIAKFG